MTVGILKAVPMHEAMVTRQSQITSGKSGPDESGEMDFTMDRWSGPSERRRTTEALQDNAFEFF